VSQAIASAQPPIDRELVEAMQVFRIIELVNTPADEPGETVPSEATAARAMALLGNLWNDVPRVTRGLLSTVFVTRTGYGTLQVEWEMGDRYLEIEVPEQGPLEFLTERGGAYEEFESDDDDAVEHYLAFWNA
jgi:hypothetical protein